MDEPKSACGSLAEVNESLWQDNLELRAQLEQMTRERDAVIGESKLAPGILELCVRNQALLTENRALLRWHRKILDGEAATLEQAACFSLAAVTDARKTAASLVRAAVLVGEGMNRQGQVESEGYMDLDELREAHGLCALGYTQVNHLLDYAEQVTLEREEARDTAQADRDAYGELAIEHESLRSQLAAKDALLQEARKTLGKTLECVAAQCRADGDHKTCRACQNLWRKFQPCPIPKTLAHLGGQEG